MNDVQNKNPGNSTPLNDEELNPASGGYGMPRRFPTRATYTYVCDSCSVKFSAAVGVYYHSKCGCMMRPIDSDSENERATAGFRLISPGEVSTRPTGTGNFI